jgi:gluconate 2-dehydrogenase gamma chain
MRRRSFIRGSGVVVAGSWIRMSLPAAMLTAAAAGKARAQGDEFKTLTATEASELEAIAAQIVPSRETPGATEAGVIYFMDAALTGSQSDALKLIRAGLTSLQAGSLNKFGIENFAGLDDAQKIELLTGIEDTPFFATVRFLTLAGLFTNPSYGGNRDQVGWKLIGFETPHASQPPFGYYDADYAAKGE